MKKYTETNTETIGSRLTIVADKTDYRYWYYIFLSSLNTLEKETDKKIRKMGEIISSLNKKLRDNNIR
jgi:hypothetical protein